MEQIKTQDDFNKYVIEELTKIIYRIQMLEKQCEEINNNTSNYEFWFNEYKKDMVINNEK